MTDNIMSQSVMQSELSAGKHKITYYMVDPGLVLQKIILKKEGVEMESYLGPVESKVVR